MTGDNSYRKGKIDALIDMIIKRLDGFEKKLDDNIEWQRSVNESLAAGNTRFEAMGNDIERLERRDERVTLFSTIAAALAGIIGFNK